MVKRYGYRATSDRQALIHIAAECWKALQKPKPSKPAVKRKGKGKAATTKNNTRATGRDKQGTADPDTGTPTAQDSLAELHAKFHSMIVDDEAFWLRILRYEPISFDELVSRAFAAGVQGKAWQPKLKRYLDLKVMFLSIPADHQGVTYYTMDPTAPRRRGRYK